jgi:hypothetical protein
MIRRIGLICLLALPAAAWGQAISVRSGEHGDFTRLVLTFDEQVAWSFGRVMGGFEFRTDKPGVNFRLDEVFHRIPRDRIRDVVDRGAGRLFLSVACACHADAFDVPGGQVALDIKDGPPGASAWEFNQPLAVVSSAEQTEDSGASASLPFAATDPPFPRHPRAARRGLPLFPGPVPLAPDTPQAPQPRVEGGDQPVEAQGDVLDPTPEPDRTARAQETQAALIEQLARAAAQGLLEPDLAPTDALVERATNPGREVEEDVSDDSGEEAPPNHPPRVDAEDGEHIRIQTSIDRDLDATRDTALTHDGADCLPDRFFDLAEWGALAETGAEIGRYRGQILGEFDASRPDQVMALARHYIYLTFGAEAAAVLRHYPEGLDRPELLQVLAEIMDHPDTTRVEFLQPQLACEGKVALWAALATPDLPGGRMIATDAVIAAFSELPLHLRRHLGPALAARFLRAGDDATALAVRNALDRAPGDHGAGFEMLEAQIDLARADPEAAGRRLEQIIEDDTAMAPDALVALIDARLDAGQPVGEREIELAAALGFERQGTTLWLALTRAEIRARAHGGDFGKALQVLAGAVGDAGFSSAEEWKLRGEILAQLVANAADAVFLRYTVGGDWDAVASQSLRRDVAARLLALGFTAEARAHLSATADVPGPDDRLLFARIALAEGKAGVAMSYLTGLEGEDARSLMADALAGLRDHRAAALLYGELGLADAQRRQAWRGGDWHELARLDSGTLGQAGAMMLAADVPPAQGEATGVLAGNRVSLAQSRRARAMLAELLVTVPVPQSMDRR